MKVYCSFLVYLLAEPVVLAEGDDLEDQVNELIALGAIYEGEDLEICCHDNTHGDMPGEIYMRGP